MSQETLTKNKLVCTVTGKPVSVAPKVFDHRALKYGSVEALRANYISAEARKLLCAGESVQDIRARLNVSSDIPEPSADIVLKYTRWAKYRKPKITYTNNISE